MTDAAERWDARYAETAAEPGEPAPFLVAQADHLPREGRAVDVAGGRGANAAWLAERGLTVTLADVSRVALGQARDVFGDRLAYAAVDLEAGDRPDGGPWDVVFMHLYYDRGVLEGLVGDVAPGGVVMLCQPTETNLERHARPSARFLLSEGEVAELASWFEARGFEILEASEGWRPSGRHDGWLIVRRPG